MLETITVEQLSPVILYHCRWQNRKNEMLSPVKYTYTYRLLYLEKGACEITVGNESYLLNEHTGIFMPPDRFYTTQMLSGEATQICNIWFDIIPRKEADQCLRALADPATRLSRQKPLPGIAFADGCRFFDEPQKLIPDSATQRMFEWLSREEELRLNLYRQLSNTYLHQILLSLLRRPQGQTNEVSNHVVLAVQQYIEEHITQELTCDEIAAACSYHRNYINRVLKSTTGSSFHQYLTDAKLCYAEKLLLNTDENITEIAYRLSFSSAAHFSNLFAKKYQMPPSQYRKLLS